MDKEKYKIGSMGNDNQKNNTKYLSLREEFVSIKLKVVISFILKFE